MVFIPQHYKLFMAHKCQTQATSSSCCYRGVPALHSCKCGMKYAVFLEDLCEKFQGYPALHSCQQHLHTDFVSRFFYHDGILIW